MWRQTLAAREARLAYWMLAPTFIVVFAIVLFPVLANFWISFKEVSLGDLRAPTPQVRERILESPATPGDTLEVRYQMRNRSRDVGLTGVVLIDTLPPGLNLLTQEERCAVEAAVLRCNLGSWEGGYRDDLELDFQTTEVFFAQNGDPLATEVSISGRASNILTNFNFTLENFRSVFESSEFWPILRTSLYYTFFGTAGSILLGLFAAQLLNANFRGRGVLRSLFLFPYIAPVIAGAFTWVFMLDPLGGSVNALGQHFNLIEQPVSFLSQRSIEVTFFGLPLAFPLALTTVIVFEIWRYFPFAFLFILARFQAIPGEIYEAADVDGASPLQQFWHLTLPQLVGILSTLFLLRFIWIFNKFDDIFLLTGGAAGTTTLPVQVYDQAFARSDIGAGAAVAVILFAVLAIFMILYFRFIPEGE